MFYQIFPSPQVKRLIIITYKQGIYQLPHKIPNNLSAQFTRKPEPTANIPRAIVHTATNRQQIQKAVSRGKRRATHTEVRSAARTPTKT